MNVEQALRQSLDALALHLIQPHGGYSPGTDFIADLARSIEARLTDHAALQAEPSPETVERVDGLEGALRKAATFFHGAAPMLLNGSAAAVHQVPFAECRDPECSEFRALLEAPDPGTWGLAAAKRQLENPDPIT